MFYYILPFLAFAAALVGVIGKTRDETKEGLLKLNWLGWTAVIIALLTFCVTVYIIYQENKKKNLIEQSANIQILRSLHGIIYPFVLLRSDINLDSRGQVKDKNIQIAGAYFFRSPNTDPFPKVLDRKNYLNIYAILLDYQKYATDLSSLRFENRPRLIDDSWLNIFIKNSANACTEMEHLFSEYINIIDSKTIQMVDELMNEWIVKRIKLLDDNTIGPINDWFKFDLKARGESDYTIYHRFLDTCLSLHSHLFDKLDVHEGLSFSDLVKNVRQGVSKR